MASSRKSRQKQQPLPEASLPRFPEPLAWKSGVLCLALTILAWGWTRNYNKLGTFYDYSLLSDGIGKLAAGLRPYRDFISPLQSLTFWVGYACELVFGRRYLSLAYGNLILSLAFFAILLHYAKREFPFTIAAFLAVSITMASTLQHGIFWYNSLGLVVLSTVALKCATLLKVKSVRTADLIVLAILVLTLGLTKLNFYVLAAGIVFLSACIYWSEQPRGRKLVYLGVLALIFGAMTLSIPVIEAVCNHTTVAAWVQNVIVTPRSRAGKMWDLLSPDFYGLVENDYYHGTVMQGGMLLCLAVYLFLALRAIGKDLLFPGRSAILPAGACLLLVINFEAESWIAWWGLHHDAINVVFRCLMIALVPAAVWVLRRIDRGKWQEDSLAPKLGALLLFWGAMSFLIVSNVDIESLPMSFCLVGLIAMVCRYDGTGAEPWAGALRKSCVLLAAYFLVVGTISCARHSRLVFKDESPFTGEKFVVEGSDYLRGVELTPTGNERMSSIREIMRNGRGSVYWGPGLEMMTRLYGGVTDPDFPLWYTSGVSVHEGDAPRLIAALERSRCQLVIVDGTWYSYLPFDLRRYLEHQWLAARTARLLVFIRR
jgi:hypothetical protein